MGLIRSPLTGRPGSPSSKYRHPEWIHHWGDWVFPTAFLKNPRHVKPPRLFPHSWEHPSQEKLHVPSKPKPQARNAPNKSLGFACLMLGKIMEKIGQAYLNPYLLRFACLMLGTSSKILLTHGGLMIGDEYHGIESVKKSPEKNKSKKMLDYPRPCTIGNLFGRWVDGGGFYLALSEGRDEF